MCNDNDVRMTHIQRIAQRNRTHRETIDELIQSGYASDKGEADEILYELDVWRSKQN